MNSTPGPWEIIPVLCNEHPSWSIRATDDKEIRSLYCEVEVGWGQDAVAIAQANANLIVAAPELLAALKEVIAWVPGQSVWHTNGAATAVQIARTAIAKAEGAQ